MVRSSLCSFRWNCIYIPRSKKLPKYCIMWLLCLPCWRLCTEDAGHPFRILLLVRLVYNFSSEVVVSTSFTKQVFSFILLYAFLYRNPSIQLLHTHTVFCLHLVRTSNDITCENVITSINSSNPVRWHFKQSLCLGKYITNNVEVLFSSFVSVMF